jgi:iron complex transport system substrate-binding protein
MKKSRHFTHCRKHFFWLPISGPRSIPIFHIGILLLWLASCKEAVKPPHAAIDQKHTRAKTSILHSKGFRIEYFENYKLVKITNRFSDKTDTLLYVLVQRGKPVPTLPAGAQVIRVPVQNLVVTSSMHVGLVDFAGATDVISGLAEVKYVTAPAVRKNLAAGKITEVGNGSAMNQELIIGMKPDLVMTMGSPDAPFSRYQTLIDAGVPVMMNAEWLETDPIGRFEWVKLMAALLNKEEVVNAKFDTIVKEYNRLKTLTATVTQKPQVIVGMPFKGSWFVPDGDSYITQLLKDAGAAYHWSNVIQPGSLALDFETVAPIALKADVWLNPGTADTKKDIADKDQRYTRFNPYQKGTIYNNTKRTNDIGSNDYWESGVCNPHLILADLITIFHPELLPGHQLDYYKQLQ